MNLAVKHSPTNESMLIWAIICSMLVHAFLVVVIPNLSFEKVELPQVLNIELTKIPEPPPPPPPTPSRPEVKANPIIKTLTKPTRSPEAPPPPPAVQTEVIAVVPKVEASPSPLPPVPVAAPEPPKLIVPSQAEINAALNGYNSALWGKIGKYKQYPKIAQMRGWQGEAVVELLLDGNGKLKSKKILTSSGYEVLDKQALDMIDKAAPFPAPPEALRASSFSITVPIPFKLE